MRSHYISLYSTLLWSSFKPFLIFLLGFIPCNAETARYSVNVNGINYQRGDRVEIFEGDDIFVELRIHFPGDPVPDRTGGAVVVYQWNVPSCFSFVRQFSPGYNNANQYVLNGNTSSCYGSTLSISHASFQDDSPLERTPVTVTIIINRRGINPPPPPPHGGARIAANSEDFQVNIFPNPTHDFINIDLTKSNSNLANISGIILYNEKQNLIKSLSVDIKNNDNEFFRSNSFQIDIKDVEKGIYFLHIDVGDRIIRKQVLIE